MSSEAEMKGAIGGFRFVSEANYRPPAYRRMHRSARSNIPQSLALVDDFVRARLNFNHP